MTSFVHMVVPVCTNSTPKATHEFKTAAHPGITSSDIKYNISHSSMVRFNESRTILSGPAGGVMWYAMTSFEDQHSIWVQHERYGAANISSISMSMYVACMHKLDKY
ncbi:unnamed protein product [Clavelina lepadiformis]|uniref:Uncharacterized protein n=1 Tax=Clavelina lepadiformis TaxID=159417 RepID=A0ABP0G713_CLALP